MPDKTTAFSLDPAGLILWTHNNTRYCLHCERDPEPGNPREYDDAFTRMACFHQRYNLGDKLRCKNLAEFFADEIKTNIKPEDIADVIKECFELRYPDEPEGSLSSQFNILLEYDIEIDEDIKLALKLCKGQIAALPIWGYDHGNIAISCGERRYPFNDRFDSGLLGYITMTKANALANATILKPDGTWALCDESNWEQAAEQFMKTDIDVYEQWLSGDVYSYTLYSASNDSCPDHGLEYADQWKLEECIAGFFGSDMFQNGAITSFPGTGLEQAILNGDFSTGCAEPVTTVRIRFNEN